MLEESKEVRWKRTWLRKGHDIGHVSHEDPALQLQLGTLVPDLRPLRSGLVLLILAFARRDLFAAKQDGLKEIDLVLHAIRFTKSRE